MTGRSSAHSASSGAPRRRDPRLDVFRGIAMLIIYIAHIPGNVWSNYIPARFGPSDAAEIFVFCSGFAAAIAFGGTYRRRGWGLGTMRVLFRCFQLYVAQIMMFLLVVALSVVGTRLFAEPDYLAVLNLYPFLNNVGDGLVGLFTLTYVPNLFDILPMYIVALAMLPVIMLLARVHVWLAMGASWVLYGFAALNLVDLPAAPWNPDIVWFFNPLGWQFLFFLGFALSAGWFRAPGYNHWLMAICVTYVAVMVPLRYWPIWREVEWLIAIRETISWWWFKTDEGFLRTLHILALAYIAVHVVNLRIDLLYARVVAPVRKVGQQALVVFVTSIVLARIVGAALDQIGRTWVTVTLANLGGMALLMLTAYFVAWIKTSPWRAATRPATVPAAALTPPTAG